MTGSIYQSYLAYTHGKYLDLSNQAHQLECASSMTEEELLKGLNQGPQDSKKSQTFAILMNLDKFTQLHNFSS